MSAQKQGVIGLSASALRIVLSVSRDETRHRFEEAGVDIARTCAPTQGSEHQAILETIDTKLIPAARDPHVKTYLQDLREAVAMDLDRAHALQTRPPK